MRGVVHHGGAGTTAAAFRAGVPQTIAWHLGDQPVWGKRVADLGVGLTPCAHRELDARWLHAPVDRMLRDRVMQGRARSAGGCGRRTAWAMRSRRYFVGDGGVSGLNLYSILVAFIGACVLIAILRADTMQPAASKVDAAMNGRKTDTPDAAEYRAVVEAAWARNPAPRDDTAAQPLWREAVAAGDAALQQALADVCDELRQSAQASDLGGGWNVPVTIRTHWGEQIALRARVARNLIGALGIEEAMYPVAEVDAQGQALDGAHRYELRFAPGAAPQVDAFWSLTMYRKSDCLLVDNPIDRYSIGDRTPGLRWDADGGLRIAIQHDEPADPAARANWLPAPREPFYVALRLYQPRQAHLDFTFTYPPVTRLE